MIKIKLTQGLFASIDDDDLEIVSPHKWCSHRIGRTVYAMTNLKLPSGKKIILHMHRKIMKPPSDLVVDHIDGNGLNNVRSNLRICTRGENAGRQKPQIGTTSRFKGVSWYKSRSKWQAYINIKGKKIGLGYFYSEEVAAVAYNEAAVRLFGDLAVLNKLEVA